MVTKLPYQTPDDNAPVTITTAGNIVKIQSMQRRNNQPTIIPLDKDHYANARTGEVFEFQRTENRTDNIQALKRQMSDARDILNANTARPEHCLFVTLTYAENMQDTKRLHMDLKHFTRDMHAHYGQFKYFTAVEPQGRGAWHAHIIMIFPDKPPFVDENAVFQNEWKRRGWVKIQKMDNCDNVGAYLTAYLCDIPIDENGAPVEQIDLSKPVPHKVEKGKRLVMYPHNMRIFRWSRDMEMPQKTVTSYKNAKRKVGDSAPTFQKALMISGDNGFTNIITTEYYNTLKGETQEK